MREDTTDQLLAAQLLAAARRYRAAFYALQAALDASHERGDATTSERLHDAREDLDAAQRALLDAALASDDAAVLLPGTEDGDLDGPWR
jgi:hypothetical protein